MNTTASFTPDPLCPEGMRHTISAVLTRKHPLTDQQLIEGVCRQAPTSLAESSMDFIAGAVLSAAEYLSKRGYLCTRIVASKRRWQLAQAA